MTLKSILVHVDDSKHRDARLAAAMALAELHDAHLTGLYVVAPPYIPTYMAAQVGAEVFEMQAKLARDAAEKARNWFEDKAQHAGIAWEWRAAEGYVATVIATHVRYADIAVLGQPAPGETEMLVTEDLAGQVILDAGRPVLLLPYAGQTHPIGTRVLVAWNGSREAARAVNDALSLLLRAETVFLVNVNPEKRSDADGEMPGADIALHLARHGVKAEAAPAYGTDIDVGDVLLSRAADLSADLIVMGAYGHSRFRELVLGGASRHILRHMTVPVLMSN